MRTFLTAVTLFVAFPAGAQEARATVSQASRQQQSSAVRAQVPARFRAALSRTNALQGRIADEPKSMNVSVDGTLLATGVHANAYHGVSSGIETRAGGTRLDMNRTAIRNWLAPGRMRSHDRTYYHLADGSRYEVLRVETGFSNAPKTTRKVFALDAQGHREKQLDAKEGDRVFARWNGDAK